MIGDKIRERRLELGITQLQLSQLTDIKKNTISNYENNVSSPSEENIFKLMEALKCDANYLFEWEENEDLKLTLEEKRRIKKYRFLDLYGRKAVDGIIDIEYERCMKANEDNVTVLSTVAARTTTNEQSIKQEYIQDLSKYEPDKPDF